MTGPSKATLPPNATEARLKRVINDNRLALELFGAHHTHLAHIERALDVSIDARGNHLTIVGDEVAVRQAGAVLDDLLGRLQSGQALQSQDIDAALRMAVAPSLKTRGDDVMLIALRQKTISARSPTQKAYVHAIDRSELVFGLGPAGTGKTYLAVAKAVERLVSGSVDRIILSRPAVEAGEQLGFLPGSMREKVDPYLRPLYDALYDMLPANQVARRLESGEIEVAPLAFMRGRTLTNAFVILDEAQNTTAVQMKMFLTRLGEHARMVVTGDLSQVDLPKGTRSGLRQAIEILEGVNGIDCIHFSDRDVVRHPLVARIVRAYDEAEVRMKSGARYEASESNRRDT